MSKQIYTKSSKLVRIDWGLHKELKILAAKSGRTIRSLIEESLADYLAVDRRNDEKS